MAAWVFVKNGSVYGLTPDGTRPLSEPMLTHQHGPVAFTKKTIPLAIFKISITKLRLKIKHLQSENNLKEDDIRKVFCDTIMYWVYTMKSYDNFRSHK